MSSWSRPSRWSDTGTLIAWLLHRPCERGERSIVPGRYPPDDPREWLNRARSDLALAKVAQESVYLEDLCFHAQQGAEKAIKALLVKLGVEFPYVLSLDCWR